LTRDYDDWVHIDDIAAFNDAVRALGFARTDAPSDSRAHRRYVGADVGR